MPCSVTHTAHLSLPSQFPSEEARITAQCRALTAHLQALGPESNGQLAQLVSEYPYHLSFLAASSSFSWLFPLFFFPFAHHFSSLLSPPPHQVANHVGRWLRELLGLASFTVFKFHEQPFHGLVHAARQAILQKYPDYASLGSVCRRKKKKRKEAEQAID